MKKPNAVPRRLLRIEDLEHRYLLSVVPAVVPGDANHDGIVNGQDIGVVAANWLKTGSQPLAGDTNGDGIVNAQDLGSVASHWLQSAPKLTPPVATAGQPFSNVGVLHFSDTNSLSQPTNYSAVVTLGDGNTVTLTGTPSANGKIVADPAGGFIVQLSYTYASALTNVTFAVTVRDQGGNTTGGSTNSFSVALPIQTGSPALQLWLDPSDTSTMTLTNVAETSGSPTSNLQSASSAPFDFQGNGLSSQFTTAFWVYPEASWNNDSWLMANTKNTFGPNDIGWFVTVPIGAAGNLRTTYATSSNTYVNEDYSAAMPKANQWYFVVITYDGSQVGTSTTQDQLRQQVYVNGQQLPTATGDSLPQKLYAAANAGKLYIGAVDTAVNSTTPERFQSVGFWNHWINSATAAALWNGGAGQTYATLPAGANDPFAYYEMGEASGTRFDSTANHYNLTAGAAGVGSVTEISAWRDKSSNHLTMLFGYNPDTGLQQRQYLGIYSPTALNGTPGVILNNGAWAYAASSTISSLASGNLYLNFQVNTPGAGENEIFDFSDDVTDGQDSFMGLNYLGPAGAPDAGPPAGSGNPNTSTYVPAFHTHAGDSATHTNGWQANVVNIDNRETVGRQVANNTYFSVGQSYSFEFANINDGSTGGGNIPGPYRMWINQSPQTVYVADSNGALANLWGDGFANAGGHLSAITLGGLASRSAAGVWRISTATGNTFGDVMEYGPAITGSQDATVRQFLASRMQPGSGGSSQAAASVDGAGSPPPQAAADAVVAAASVTSSPASTGATPEKSSANDPSASVRGLAFAGSPVAFAAASAMPLGSAINLLAAYVGRLETIKSDAPTASDPVLRLAGGGLDTQRSISSDDTGPADRPSGRLGKWLDEISLRDPHAPSLDDALLTALATGRLRSGL